MPLPGMTNGGVVVGKDCKFNTYSDTLVANGQKWYKR